MRTITVSFPFPDNPLIGAAKILKRVFGTAGDEERRTIPIEKLRIEEIRKVPFKQPLYELEQDSSEAIQQAIAEIDRPEILCPVAVVGRSKGFVLREFTAPPVEAERIGEIAAFEARQQIPIPIENAVWRWKHAPRAEQGSLLLECAVQLFGATKKHVEICLAPFRKQPIGRRVDCLQSNLLTLMDYLSNFYLPQQKGEPQPVAVLEIFAESSRLVVTDGISVWERPLNFGGAHFSRALLKTFKLTFAKADYLKVYFQKSEDAKDVEENLQPMVHNFVKEVENALGFYHPYNEVGRITELMVVGGGAATAGLLPCLDRALNARNITRVDIPKCGIGLTAGVSADLFNADFGNIIHPMIAAIQRLGYGNYRENFCLGRKPFGPKIKSAWGIVLGSHSLTAVKVSRQ